MTVEANALQGASASRIQVTVCGFEHARKAGMVRILASIYAAFVLGLAVARGFDATAALGAV